MNDPGTYTILSGALTEDPQDAGIYIINGGAAEDTSDPGTYLNAA